MRLLVISGGVFLGEAVLRAARARGHAITVFRQGKLTRDREAEMSARWRTEVPEARQAVRSG